MIQVLVLYIYARQANRHKFQWISLVTMNAVSMISRIPSLQWRHNERDGVSSHRRLDCIPNRLFGCRSKKHQNSASVAFVRGIHRWPVYSPHKGQYNVENITIWWRHHDSNGQRDLTRFHRTFWVMYIHMLYASLPNNPCTCMRHLINIKNIPGMISCICIQFHTMENWIY